MAKTNFLSATYLDATLRATPYTGPVTLFVALFTTATDDTGGGTEVTDAGAYARTAITFGAAVVDTSDNDIAVIFPKATADWGIVTHVALFDTATHGAGQMQYHGAMVASAEILDTDTLIFQIGAFTVQES